MGDPKAAAALAIALALLPYTQASAQQPRTLLDAPCTAATDRPVTELETGRTYLLDYPCDLHAGEDVTFVLSLHGAGSSGTWQRRYFPAYDQKERHRLVIAAPYSPTRRWSEEDDAYLRNIVTQITDAVGAENIRAFWLAGHSQGGLTSRRIVCTDFFARRVDGFLSLSGGRLGGAAPRAADAGRPRQADEPPPPEPAPAAPAAAAATPAPGDPTCDFSHIFAIGEHEIASLPSTSTWATRYGCDARVARPDVVDDRPGYVHDGGRQNPGSRAWGLLPRPGTARVFVYPGCDDGRVVADVMRIDKGHTEGLEPAVTEALVTLMVSARGGKIQAMAATTGAVDYADEASWLCRPGRRDACAVDLAATVVRGDGTLSREAFAPLADAPIDCFYVYPTVSTDRGVNSDMEVDEAELRVVHQQFARFGSVCRTYAPMYRQVTLAGLRQQSGSLERGLAYEDVLAAFRHYIDEDNGGRGFVLVGHSQGSFILSRLIAEEIDGKALQDRMVSALLLGSTVTVAEGKDVGGAFRAVPLCRSSSQTGCVVTYVSFRSTAPPPSNTRFGRTTAPGLRAACTDPTQLAGTGGDLHAYLSADGTTIIGRRPAPPWLASGASIETPFVSAPGLLTARCASNENATYLEITVHGEPADPRADDIGGDLSPDWGLHLVDANLAMGNLLEIVRRQSAAFVASR